MPMYNYVCKNCGSAEELFRSISNRDNEATCKNCGSVSLQRQVGSPLIAYHVHVNGAGKPPDGFMQVLKKIHANCPGSRINETCSYW